MNYIKKLHIEGFKKFKELEVEFNEHINILVGENEAGKSTILEAIKIVLNQLYKNTDKSVLKDLFSSENVDEFKANPSMRSLPKILIEIEFDLDPKAKNAEYFWGELYGSQKSQEEKFGISFECKFDEVLGSGLNAEIESGKIPYEYYSLSWKTFGNKPYQNIKKPLNFLSIDILGKDSLSSFNYYNKTLFASRVNDEKKINAKYQFREKVESSFDQIGLEPIDQNRKFGVDTKKVPLETILSVYDNGIALENHGCGMECLIKTHIALDKKSGLNVILMEEPENHLCFSNLRKMLSEIVTQQDSSQLIITTHSNMIASHLNLNNVLWIANNQVELLKKVNKDDAAFFVKSDDNSFLQLLLSKKVFLVEGATESLLLPKFYKQETGRTIEEDGVSVISCGGISYKRYLSIAETTKKKVAVITDNDGNQNRITESSVYNSNHENQHVFMGKTIAEWTWEASVYALNQAVLNPMIAPDPKAQYLFHKQNYGPYLGKMLQNKAEIAYQMLNSKEIFEVPQYVKDAITWLNK